MGPFSQLLFGVWLLPQCKNLVGRPVTVGQSQARLFPSVSSLGRAKLASFWL